jgi:diacylglycerol kinase family enzyme
MIINHNSGSGFATSITGRLDDYFRSKGMGMRICRVNEFGDIKRNVEVAAKSSECRLVVVTGGDGTVREAAQHLIGSGKPLMIIPGGTENLLAHELGCDRNIDTYIRMYEQDSITALDLIRVNGCYFTSILGIGFDAEVVHILSRVRSGNITHADYIWPIWRAFWSHDIPSFCVEADGEQVFSGRGMFFAGNISRYATGLRILQNANLCDGMLDVCVYPCRNKPDILKFLSMTMLGIHTKSEDVVYRKCRKVRVRALDKNVVTQIDGDPGPLLPLDIEVVPGAVNVYNCIYKSRQGGTA